MPATSPITHSVADKKNLPPTPLQQRLERPIWHSTFPQRLNSTTHIIERRPISPRGTPKHGFHNVIRQLARIRGDIPPHHKSKRIDAPPIGKHARQPRRTIRTHRHFTSPERFQMGHRAVSGKPERNPTARSATVQREHQPRLLRRPAIHPRPQIQPAMIAMHPRPQRLDSRQTGIPDQRAVTEQPQVALAIPVSQRAIERRAQFIVRQQPRFAERRRIVGARLTRRR
jgi:hypothetical protein